MNCIRRGRGASWPGTLPGFAAYSSRPLCLVCLWWKDCSQGACPLGYLQPL